MNEDANDKAALLKLITAEHGLILDPDDPVLVVGTIANVRNEQLLAGMSELLMKAGRGPSLPSRQEQMGQAVLIANHLDQRLLRRRLTRADWFIGMAGAAALLLSMALIDYGARMWLADFSIRSWLAGSSEMGLAACHREQSSNHGVMTCTFWTHLPPAR
jgi:hypothetical protein